MTESLRPCPTPNKRGNGDFNVKQGNTDFNVKQENADFKTKLDIFKPRLLQVLPLLLQIPPNRCSYVPTSLITCSLLKLVVYQWVNYDNHNTRTKTKRVNKDNHNTRTKTEQVNNDNDNPRTKTERVNNDDHNTKAYLVSLPSIQEPAS